MRETTHPLPDHYGTDDWEDADARELRIGDRVVNWNGEAGTVLTVTGENFRLRYDSMREMDYQWFEFTAADVEEYWGSFRFEDTEYPEWPC